MIVLDPELEKTLRRNFRTPVEWESTVEVGDQPVLENVDLTRSLRDLFTPIAINSPLCIVLPPTNATQFDLKPHVIQLLLSFHSLEMENPYNHVKKLKDRCATFKFQNFLRCLFIWDCFVSFFTIEPRHGWTQSCPILLHLGKSCWASSTISFFQCPNQWV